MENRLIFYCFLNKKDTFAKRFGVKLYGFVPSLVYYLDNQIRFAFREEVRL